MKPFKILVYFILPFFVLSACKKDDENQPAPTPPTPKETNLIINLSYNVDGQSIIYDSINYFNEAANNYSIEKLQYYLSGFKFIKSEGGEVAYDNVYYIDSRIVGTNTITIKNFPSGNYIGIEFYIGLDSAHNVTSALPNTIENVNMAWPEPMGGGYHFMKLEGHFISGASTFGYAMHLGLNPYVITVELAKTFTVTKDISNNLNLSMNINEWYKNPQIYDFNVDGNYSMGSMPAMMKLSVNGRDVFNE